MLSVDLWVQSERTTVSLHVSIRRRTRLNAKHGARAPVHSAITSKGCSINQDAATQLDRLEFSASQYCDQIAHDGCQSAVMEPRQS